MGAHQPLIPQSGSSALSQQSSVQPFAFTGRLEGPFQRPDLITDSIVGLVKALVEIEITSSNQNAFAHETALGEMRDFLHSRLAVPLHVHRLAKQGDAPTWLISAIPNMADIGGWDFDVLFVAHADVVPAFDRNAFKLREGSVVAGENGKLFGRGVLDMKGPLAAIMELLITHRTDGILDRNGNLDWAKKRGGVALAISTTEEQGGFDCIGELVKSKDEGGYGVSARVVIYPDGGYGFRLVTEQKGVLQMKLDYSASGLTSEMPVADAHTLYVLKAKGFGAHGARPYQGQNALWMLNDAMVALERMEGVKGAHILFANVGEQTNAVPENGQFVVKVYHDSDFLELGQGTHLADGVFIHAASDHGDFDSTGTVDARVRKFLSDTYVIDGEFQRANSFNPMKTSVNLGVLRADKNGVFGHIDIRRPASEDAEGIIAEVKRIAGMAECSIDFNEPAFTANTSHPIFDFAREAIRKRTGDYTGDTREEGSGDARFFNPMQSIEDPDRCSTVLVFGPHGEGHHSETEWVYQQDLYELFLIMEDILQETFALYTPQNGPLNPDA